ncbi:GNS1/SUR4 family protein [Heterostelium album PN500]|uniref:Elongation of fatty acids protein n=1 Tax=Heterostelium pallidum (strain ATCC 26659 / Pp 5 / PN500) TaxID=670386 RepID=D3B6N1_HETP5|nr:GNS1/SUR4 family protein [Heterostelium album PN500]EFA83001.1 GNS1/SUR4 family protein [Heterostelium album PN500]|eukprot:XP_020435118.1 GNS1/SUR4 family protein [Heterostelium album PN500]
MATTYVKEYVDFLVERYDYYLARRDERVMHWPFLNRPNEMLYLIAAYLVFVVVGKKIMANRKPFDLKIPLILHNLILLLISIYITIETAYQAYINDYSLMCNAVDYSDKGIGMAKVLWLFFFSKSIEMMDTVFMILRKKFDQVSVGRFTTHINLYQITLVTNFLHVYHHSSIFFLWWIGANWTPGGDAYFSAMINSFIHVVMYGYYLLAALKIDVWWKRYLTQLQLIQFIINLFSSIYVLYNDCPFPHWMFYGMIIYMFSMLFLFGAFYSKAYIRGLESVGSHYNAFNYSCCSVIDCPSLSVINSPLETNVASND